MIVINDLPIELKPYSLGELANIYKVSSRTLKKWILPILQKIGKRNGRFYTINQVAIIFSTLGIPSKVVEDTCIESCKVVYLDPDKNKSIVLP